MRTVNRGVAGHFCDAENIQFFMHTDIMSGEHTEPYSEASFCVSLIGEYSYGWGNLNSSGKTYELMVFDKESENPWTEIESFLTDDKQEAIDKFKSLVKKYSNIVKAGENAIKS